MPVALVTGCSSGFGAAIAVALAQRGYQVVATMRKPDSAPPSLKALAAEKSAAVVIAPLDVTNPVMRKAAIDLALQRFGRLDLLVNNAGITARGAFEDTPKRCGARFSRPTCSARSNWSGWRCRSCGSKGAAASSTSHRSPRS